MIKKLLKIVVAIVVLVVVAAAIGWFYIDSLAKTAIETGATYALGVKTTVDSVSLGLVAGTARIDGLTVANPEGYKTPHLVKTGRFDLTVRPGSLLEDTVEINRFVLDGLDLHIEQKLGAGTNVAKILDHLKTPGDAEPEKKPAEGGKKVKVDRIVIRNVVAHVQVLPIGGQASTLDVKIPEIIMDDVTSDNAQGIAVSELTRRLMPAILAAVVDKGKGIIPDADLKKLGDGVVSATKALGEGAGKLVNQVGKGAGKLLEGIFKKPDADDAAGDGPKKPNLGDALKDLFKKKD